ncbi:alanine racemase [Erysipelothrix rhusiopathiae]|nr:alanine racemase [Erysipelothrix rhusiopathiae]
MNLKELCTSNNELKTPCYIFDVDFLEEHVKEIKASLPNNTKLCYAMKANPFLVGILNKMVDSFEVCSPGEYRICKRNNISNRKIILSGVYKNSEDIREIIQMEEQPIYTVESMKQLELLNDLSTEYQKQINVILRLTSGNQFGMDASEIERVLDQTSEYHFLKWHGIQLYSGTQKHKLNKVQNELESLKSYIETLRSRYQISLPCLEFGPGLGVQYFESDKPTLSVSEFSSVLRSLSYDGTIVLEMGRIIVAACGTYLTRVVDIKTNDMKHYAILDGGIHHVSYYGQFLGMKCPSIERIDMEKSPELHAQWNLCGSLCTVADVLIKDYETPLGLNDIVAFKNVGAYSITEGISLFLSRDLPQVNLYRKQTGIEIIRDTIEIDRLNSVKEK